MDDVGAVAPDTHILAKCHTPPAVGGPGLVENNLTTHRRHPPGVHHRVVPATIILSFHALSRWYFGSSTVREGSSSVGGIRSAEGGSPDRLAMRAGDRRRAGKIFPQK